MTLPLLMLADVSCSVTVQPALTWTLDTEHEWEGLDL